MTQLPLRGVSVPGQGPAGPAARAVEALRVDFAGDLLAADDPAYDEARRVWNRAIDRRPALVARCTGVADVRAALAFARAEGLDLTVRGGGHAVAGLAVADGALLLDLSAMRGVRVDPEARRVWVQGGAKLRDMDRETLPYGLGSPTGTVGDTGVGGLTLGGGYGWSTRRYGLACDNLVRADVVTADGDLVVVDEDHHPDLLWGLRGGGGNFGVVTGFELAVHPMSVVSTGDLVYPAADGVRALRAFLDFTRDAPDETATVGAVTNAPAVPFIPEQWHGRPVVWLSWVHHGSLDAGRAAVAALVDAAGPSLAAIEGETSYATQQGASGPPPGAPDRRYWKGGLIRDLPESALEALVTRGTGSVDQPVPVGVEITGLGGAFGRVGSTETAFANRDAGFDVLVATHWSEPADDAGRLATARGVFAAVAPHTTGAYINSLGDEHGVGGGAGPDGSDGQAEVAAAYGGSTYRRLVELKDRWDPDNVFHHNHNVVPSPS